MRFSENFAQEPDRMEREILDFWKKNRIFEKLMEKTKDLSPFRFFEGPPYANGRPGIHHVLTRVFKDAVIRFKTMNGFYVERKAGWDTHGLPTEVEVEKILGIVSKKEIEEKIGLGKFVREAKQNVFLYKKEWEKLTERIGFWLDMKDPYITMETTYIETLWWLFKRFHERGLLYNDEKILPWCSRCETSLSSHELAQGYKAIRDYSLYIKFKLKNENEKAKTNFLVWTTTPWTLPANAALALNPSAIYITVEKDGEWLILGEKQLNLLSEPYKIIASQKGEHLAGVEYEPLYPDEESLENPRSYKVYAADFVSTEEGTGIVHIAPAFGADDMTLGKKYDLPAIKTLKQNGRFDSPGKPWHQKYFKEANELIIKDLGNRDFIFKKETIEHDYPFCWRCSEPLIYYAKKAWFLKTTAVKEKMLSENEKINWHPEFMKKGRFGEWLKENVDWAISRERYWGTPLPIWECEKCKNINVAGSLEDLNKFRLSSEAATFYLMRHAEARHNAKNTGAPVDLKLDAKDGLTERGKKQAALAAKKLEKEKIDLIVFSPLRRARETAEIISRIAGIPRRIEPFKEFSDIHSGKYQGKKEILFKKDYPFPKKLTEAPRDGENLRDVRKRMIKALRNLVEENPGKKIVVISHGDPLWVTFATLNAVPEKKYPQSWYPKPGEFKKIDFPNYPFNDEGEVDLHKPYIDEIKLRCFRCAAPARRVKEVADVWFDSGAMPFAEHHYPFENKEQIQKKKHFPADFICEGIDQTRGWFYTLLAVSALSGFEAPYKNVLAAGLVLDEKGEKMSKSKGNVVEPFELVEKYGMEAVRWYFYTINQPWDEKKFKEEDVAKALRGFLLIFWNVLQYFKTCCGAGKIVQPKTKSTLNKWLLAKSNKITVETFEDFEKYELVSAARRIENFVVEDISRWYVRRIREAMKMGTIAEKKEISLTLGFALLNIAKITAPFIPFLSEIIHQELGGGLESVHFEKWPKAKKLSKSKKDLLVKMEKTREITSKALEERAKAGVKVRQPLGLMKINEELEKDFLDLIKGETNVREIIIDKNLKEVAQLDFTITPKLKEEGFIREFIREIQQLRKHKNLKSRQKITLLIETGENAKKILKAFEKTLKKEINIKNVYFGRIEKPEFRIKIEEFDFSLKIGFNS